MAHVRVDIIDRRCGAERENNEYHSTRTGQFPHHQQMKGTVNRLSYKIFGSGAQLTCSKREHPFHDIIEHIANQLTNLPALLDGLRVALEHVPLADACVYECEGVSRMCALDEELKQKQKNKNKTLPLHHRIRIASHASTCAKADESA